MSFNYNNKNKGLYYPSFDHDACGVGMVANIHGKASNKIIEQGLTILDNLAHRGACGADPDTGDGGGILLSIPHEFFAKQLNASNVNIPDIGEYAVGMVFIPNNAKDKEVCKKLIEEIIKDENIELLSWREVPIKDEIIGYDAKSSMPLIMQVFVKKPTNINNEDDFEKKLYVLRRRIEISSTTLELNSPDDFYFCSFSCRTIVYKGLLTPEQVKDFYPDLKDTLFKSWFGLVHSRFSTNTLGKWKLSHPYRYVAHNGEINTVRGNSNWMSSREKIITSDSFGEDVTKIVPILEQGDSDTASLDKVFELLTLSGRSLPHVMAMMVPQAWEGDNSISPELRAFYEYHSCLMEPWDGPALVAFTNGKQIGANLDRNGLRPFRFSVTNDGLIVMSSETGVLELDSEKIQTRGRLQPGKMMIVDPEQGRIIFDNEIKEDLAKLQPYQKWVAENLTRLENLPEISTAETKDNIENLSQLQRSFGYTDEELRMLLVPMGQNGAEAIGSMGTDTPIAILSNKTQSVFSYFKQLFAQVSNPPLDAIREELVTSLEAPVGCEQELFKETDIHCQQLKLSSPILTNQELAKIKNLNNPGLKTATVSCLYSIENKNEDLEETINKICERVSDAINEGNTLIVLSDRGVSGEMAAIPSLLILAAVHHDLIRRGLRSKAGLIVESGEPREVMHFALLLGYGAAAINPYLAYATLDSMLDKKEINVKDLEYAVLNYKKAIHKGLLKIASKMGISTIQSYRGAQIFECIGFNDKLIEKYFCWTPSRIGGIGIEELELDMIERHSKGFSEERSPTLLDLDSGGQYQWRRDGEYHMYNPFAIAKLQESARIGSYSVFKEFAELIDKQDQQLSTLRGLLEFKEISTPLDISEVESADNIVKRFATGAISLGAISPEAHETLAIAMNKIGARSNTGEGGEDSRRFSLDEDGENRNSAIKQVASGRFGVTTNYLVNATDLQIKMAQGSKPGEGGQLPGHKVDDYIGWVRHTTPGVELISPPPHHDIYSIEDLAQLIHDLKNVNSNARIHVKLVAEAGVGTIAAGVSKGHGDVVLISGDSGGTGASPETSIKHAGLPWELGIAETQQVLVENDLRGRIVVQADGQLKTGRDVAIACLLGAEEFGFATAPLVTMGCIMLRKCHLNACSVGIATQDSELRKNFAGKPEHVINYFYFIAEHMREIMASLGFKTVNEMIGRVDKLDSRVAIDHWKAKGLDFSKLLYKPQRFDEVDTYCVSDQDHALDKALDNILIENAELAINNGENVTISHQIKNSNRTVGAMLSGEVAKKYGEDGLKENTINVEFKGSAGQSFGAFLAKGITFNLEGDANDYIGKGMSGGRISVRPPKESKFIPEENIITGNVSLYGATGGEMYLRGMAGERFAVRNSGAMAVVEGVGDHGCEYMTGGIVVVLGSTGRNFAAGMSGGISYVYDPDGTFIDKCNSEMVKIGPLDISEDEIVLKNLIENHLEYTGSENANKILNNWEQSKESFIKVMPSAYALVLEQQGLALPKEMEKILNG